MVDSSVTRIRKSQRIQNRVSQNPNYYRSARQTLGIKSRRKHLFPLPNDNIRSETYHNFGMSAPNAATLPDLFRRMQTHDWLARHFQFDDNIPDDLYEDAAVLPPIENLRKARRRFINLKRNGRIWFFIIIDLNEHRVEINTDGHRFRQNYLPLPSEEEASVFARALHALILLFQDYAFRYIEASNDLLISPADLLFLDQINAEAIQMGGQFRVNNTELRRRLGTRTTLRPFLKAQQMLSRTRFRSVFESPGLGPKYTPWAQVYKNEHSHIDDFYTTLDIPNPVDHPQAAKILFFMARQLADLLEGKSYVHVQMHRTEVFDVSKKNFLDVLGTIESSQFATVFDGRKECVCMVLDIKTDKWWELDNLRYNGDDSDNCSGCFQTSGSYNLQRLIQVADHFQADISLADASKKRLKSGLKVTYEYYSRCCYGYSWYEGYGFYAHGQMAKYYPVAPNSWMADSRQEVVHLKTDIEFQRDVAYIPLIHTMTLEEVAVWISLDPDKQGNPRFWRTFEHLLHDKIFTPRKFTAKQETNSLTISEFMHELNTVEQTHAVNQYPTEFFDELLRFLGSKILRTVPMAYHLTFYKMLRKPRTPRPFQPLTDHQKIQVLRERMKRLLYTFPLPAEKYLVGQELPGFVMYVEGLKLSLQFLDTTRAVLDCTTDLFLTHVQVLKTLMEFIYNNLLPSVILSIRDEHQYRGPPIDYASYGFLPHGQILANDDGGGPYIWSPHCYYSITRLVSGVFYKPLPPPHVSDEDVGDFLRETFW